MAEGNFTFCTFYCNLKKNVSEVSSVCADCVLFRGSGPGHSFSQDPALPQNTTDEGPVGSPRTKGAKFSVLVSPCVLQHKHGSLTVKKQCTKKNKGEAAGYAKLLTKRKGPKTKARDRLPKDRSCLL